MHKVQMEWYASSMTHRRKAANMSKTIEQLAAEHAAICAAIREPMADNKAADLPDAFKDVFKQGKRHNKGAV